MMEEITEFAPAARSQLDELERQRKLLESGSPLRTLLDAMPDFVMVLNANRQIVFGNSSLVDFARAQNCELIGLRPGELLKCRYALRAACGCGTAAACRECGAISTILNALAGTSGFADCRILQETDEGPSALDLRVWGTPFRWEGEQFALIVAADISHEKRRKVLERIFFHDILNTAGVIDSMTQMLLTGYVSFEEVKSDLRETARKMVEEIITQRELLAAENNELAVRVIEVATGDFLQSLARMHANDGIARGKEIVVSPEAEDLPLRTDPTLLSRVMGNLVKNALEASREGERVTVDCRRIGDSVAFSCRNPAVIPPDIQVQIFNRSFSTKGSGRGIGTYSVKLLTEKYLKGSVSFTSTAEYGTTFTVLLPLNPL